MLNTIMMLFKKKSFILMGIIAPAIIIVFFSFAFGNNLEYKVGIVNNDKGYIANEVVQAINKIENVDIVDISKESYELLLASHQIQIAVIINSDFTYKTLNLENNSESIVVKSISNNDVKETIILIMESKIGNLNTIAKISNRNIETFKANNEAYKSNLLNYTVNEQEKSRPNIENSLGLVIMMILISGSSIASFLIEDEEGYTKTRVLVSGVHPYKYYAAVLIVFYLLSALSSGIYYGLCILFNLDFGMSRPTYFLVVLLMLNLVAIALNLCIVSFTRSRYIASTVNILIVIPTCMISGVFWDFEIMPKYLQKIGSLMPQRIVYTSIETLQSNGKLSSICYHILYMITIALILFIVSQLMDNVLKENG